MCIHIAGYTCEEHNNPADFFLDILSGGIFPSVENGPCSNSTIAKPNGIACYFV